MTVAELIEKLKAMPQDAEVIADGGQDMPELKKPCVLIGYGIVRRFEPQIGFVAPERGDVSLQSVTRT